MSLKPFKYFGADEFLKSHLKKVIDGEYEFGSVEFPHNPTVLDLGANLGAYSYWILNKIPNAHVIAFEPLKTSAEYYLKNMQASGAATWSYCIINAAVYPTTDKEITLYLSDVNSGMHSLDKDLTNTPNAAEVKVRVCHPDFLPNCDILKLDVEGSELPILESYMKLHKPPSIISIEYHHFAARYDIEKILDEYILISGYIIHPNLGTLTYAHKTAIPPDGI